MRAYVIAMIVFSSLGILGCLMTLLNAKTDEERQQTVVGGMIAIALLVASCYALKWSEACV